MKVDTKITRNGELDFLRFLFSVIVFSFHLDCSPISFKGGYLGVEFFFVCSGFFLMKFIEKRKDQELSVCKRLAYYFCDRMKRLYIPYLFVAVCAYFIRFAILGDIS